MRSMTSSFVGAVVAIVVALASRCSAEPPNLDPVKGAIEEMVVRRR